MEQIKCYCGHTTYCDCEPLEVSDKAKERAANYMSLKGALEPKQETVEEAAKKYCLIYNIPTDQMIVKNDRSCEFETPTTMFIKGAKWQSEQMYSEEEIFNLCRDFAIFVQQKKPSYKKQLEYFEQFKKK